MSAVPTKNQKERLVGYLQFWATPRSFNNIVWVFALLHKNTGGMSTGTVTCVEGEPWAKDILVILGFLDVQQAHPRLRAVKKDVLL
jgi:hypothetical protein